MVFPQHSGGGGRNIMTSKSAWNTQWDTDSRNKKQKK
jgi:hypothetical protein